VGMFVFFFFFQAEDGIRDLYVTGVQTCALPILAAAVLVISGSMGAGKTTVLGEASDLLAASGIEHAAIDLDTLSIGLFAGDVSRSEERRVGKECRSRGAPDQ